MDQSSKVRALFTHGRPAFRKPAVPTRLRGSVITIAAKPKLLDQVHQAIRTRHYSPQTEETYVGWIKRFIFYHNKRHPTEMSEKEIARFPSSLSQAATTALSPQGSGLHSHDPALR